MTQGLGLRPARHWSKCGEWAGSRGVDGSSCRALVPSAQFHHSNGPTAEPTCRCGRDAMVTRRAGLESLASGCAPPPHQTHSQHSPVPRLAPARRQGVQCGNSEAGSLAAPFRVVSRLYL
ncbi:unnamed protein product [Protopolystoma xenopodis]|uniref:Uncharacterized protein n=1 Tax=Protopolystoma xenopodis TaxID=117903 RepID=A0A3S5CHM7_9PLAT|nr:unnamed protein product [Protopolystoma xenopodis]